MKRDDIKKLAERPVAELEANLKELQEKHRALKFDLMAGKVKNVGELRTIKKDIARTMTFLNAKQ
jgi:ribosomal protein L29